MNATTPHFIVIVSRTGIWVRTRGENRSDQDPLRWPFTIEIPMKSLVCGSTGGN